MPICLQQRQIIYLSMEFAPVSALQVQQRSKVSTPPKTSDLNSMIPIDKPKTSKDGAEMVLSMALIPETFKRPNGTFLLDI